MLQQPLPDYPLHPIGLSIHPVLFFFPAVQASEVRTAIFEGKPCINPPHVVGNYPATPFLFYIPTSGERPIKWHAENLPKGLKLDKETGIIK